MKSYKNWPLIIKTSAIFSMIFIFSLCNFFTIKYFKNKEKNDAILVNVSGRNRMLSQRIGLFSEIVVNGNKEAKKVLRSVIDLHDASVKAMKDGGIAPGIPGEIMLESAPESILPYIETIEGLWTEYKKNAEIIYANGDSLKQKEALLFLENNCTQMLKINNELVTAYVNLNNEKQKAVSLLLIIFLVINLFLIAIALLMVRNRVVNPILLFSREIGVFSNGDISNKITITAEDEIGQAQRAMRTLMNNFRQVISKVTATSQDVDNSVSALSNTSQELSQGANRQAASVEELSATIEEIAANIQQNTENAQQTEKIATAAQSGIQEINSESAQAVNANRQITEKINIVSDIAFQTNILALNAAVEAARAGEHGKGFAVVASEVRKLAERSKMAADEIVYLTSNSLSLSESAGKRMDEILPEVTKTANLVQEISSSSQEQSKGATQVHSAIQQLNGVTQQNAATSEELAASAQELKTKADELTEMISFFKVNGNTSNNYTAPEPNTAATSPKTGETKTYESKSTSVKLDLSAGDSDNEFESF